jgi:hypothetical protein
VKLGNVAYFLLFDESSDLVHPVEKFYGSIITHLQILKITIEGINATGSV